MNEALGYLYYIYEKFIAWIFNDALLFPGVSLGWILADGAVFAMLIRSIINVPTATNKNSGRGTDKKGSDK